MTAEQQPGGASAAFQADLLRILEVEPGLESALRGGEEATDQLLAFHAGWVATRGSRLCDTSGSVCVGEPIEDAPPCPACGQTTFGSANHSLLYPGYRRTQLSCPHHGVIADLGPGWTITRIRVEAAREPAATVFAFTASATSRVTAAAVIEFRGEPGAVGPLVRGVNEIRASVRVAEVLAAGVYRVVLVAAAAGDVGYLRMPVALR